MARIIVLLEIEPSEVGNSPTMMKDSLITFSLLLPPVVRDKTPQGKLSLIGLIKASHSPSPSFISHARTKTKQMSKARWKKSQKQDKEATYFLRWPSNIL
jgi:hypothetical protein